MMFRSFNEAFFESYNFSQNSTTHLGKLSMNCKVVYFTVRNDISISFDRKSKSEL